MKFEYDCVYYWQGGVEKGRWMQTDLDSQEELRRRGYVLHKGKTTIGPPVGPPPLDELHDALKLKTKLRQRKPK